MKSNQIKDFPLKDIINELPGYENKQVQTLRKDIFEKHKYDRLLLDDDFIYCRTPKDVYKKGKSHEYHITENFFNILREYLSYKEEFLIDGHDCNMNVLGTTTMKELNKKFDKISEELTDESEIGNRSNSNIPEIIKKLNSLKKEISKLADHNKKVTDAFLKLLYNDYKLLSENSKDKSSIRNSNKSTDPKKSITFDDFKDDVVEEDPLSALQRILRN